MLQSANHNLRKPFINEQIKKGTSFSCRSRQSVTQAEEAVSVTRNRSPDR